MLRFSRYVFFIYLKSVPIVTYASETWVLKEAIIQK